MSWEALDYLTENLRDLRRVTYTATDPKTGKTSTMRAIQGEEGLALLMFLAYHADAEGVAYPGERLMAAATGQHRRNIQRNRDSLVAGGLIERVEDRFYKGQRVGAYLLFPWADISKGGRDTAPSRLSTGGRDTAPSEGQVDAEVDAEVDAITQAEKGAALKGSNPRATRVSGETGEGKTVSFECITQTPTPTGDRLDSPGKAAAGGKEKTRWETVVEAAWALDQVNPLTNPGAQRKRRKAIEAAALDAVRDYPAANANALRDLVLCRVHDTEPDRDLLLYLDEQQAAVEGLVASDYSDPDTEPEWWALDEPAPQVRDTPLVAARSEQPEQHTPATWSSSAGYREALDAANAMRRKSAGAGEPGAASIGGLVSSEALKVARNT